MKTNKDLIFILPKPPALSALYTNNRWTGGRVRTKKYNEWADAAGWAMKQQAKWETCGDCVVTINLYTVRNQDIDNIIKPVFDLLTHMLVFIDDWHVISVLATKHIVKHMKDQRIHVMVKPL